MKKTSHKSKKSAFGAVLSCQVCGAKTLEPVLDLGHHAIVQNYLNAKQLNEPETTYPLRLVRCSACTLVQLDYIVDQRLVFPLSYPYRTGLTNMLLRNFEELAEKMKIDGQFKERDVVVDIGSNDGSLLKSFKSRGARVAGVEPTDAAKVANKSGIFTLQEYFTDKSAAKIIKKFGNVKVITATNVFAHILDTAGLVRAIKLMMNKESIFVSESQYLGDIVDHLEFDTIYHEHLRFYSLTSLVALAKKFGLSIIDAERISAAGGSVRVWMMLGKKEMSSRAQALLKEEVESGLTSKEKMHEFASRCIAAKQSLLALVLDIKQSGKAAGATIAAISSSARSNTLLGFSKITPDVLSYAGERKGSPKIGLYTPGAHIPVVDEEKIFKDQPEYALLLSWHIGEELMRIYRKIGYKGKFIMPLPEAKIID